MAAPPEGRVPFGMGALGSPMSRTPAPGPCPIHQEAPGRSAAGWALTGSQSAELEQKSEATKGICDLSVALEDPFFSLFV